MSCRSLSSLLLACAFSLVATMAAAERVNFEEFPAMDDPDQSVAEEYADLGLHFVMAGAVWSGRSEGDAGGWGLEGTSGPSFLGIDAPVYNMVMRFDWPVSLLSFDFARSEAGNAASLLVFGYRDGRSVEMVSMDFPDAADTWQTVELTEDVDIVVCIQLGSVPYGVDAMRWDGPLGDGPEEVEVDLDIKPGSARNPVHVGSRGVIPMVLYGADDFAVEDVDPSTLRFGPGEAAIAHANGPHPVDHDGDGLLDWMIHMPTPESAIAEGDVEACLDGETFDGVAFFGCDLVTPVAGGRGAAKKR